MRAFDDGGRSAVLRMFASSGAGIATPVKYGDA